MKPVTGTCPPPAGATPTPETTSPTPASRRVQPFSWTVAPLICTVGPVSLTRPPEFLSSTDPASILAELVGPSSSIPAFVTGIEKRPFGLLNVPRKGYGFLSPRPQDAEEDGKLPYTTPGASAAIRASAWRAASCSAAFFEGPCPTPISSPSMFAAQVNVRSWGGPWTSRTA